MVQEPALTLIERAGGRVLVNLMDLRQAERFLGGPYEFMGVAVRRDEWSARRHEMQAIARALTRALRYVHYGTPKLVVQALPPELIAGGERDLFERVLARHRRSLYPQEGRIHLDAVRRVVEIQQQAGLLPGPCAWRSWSLTRSSTAYERGGGRRTHGRLRDPSGAR